MKPHQILLPEGTSDRLEALLAANPQFDVPHLEHELEVTEFVQSHRRSDHPVDIVPRLLCDIHPFTTLDGETVCVMCELAQPHDRITPEWVRRATESQLPPKVLR